MQLTFETLKLKNGLAMPVLSFTDTGQEGHYWGGEPTSGTVPEIIPQRVWRVGTYGRLMFHGPRAMGVHVTLPPGDRFVIITQQPLTLLAE